MKTMIGKPAWICLIGGGLLISGLLSICGCPAPSPEPTGPYVGAEVCAQCHANIHTEWSETLHAAAVTALQSVGQAENPGCLPCHTTGYGQEGGFVSLPATPELAGVQCEDCHGPARQHVMNVTDATLAPIVPVASDVCGKCHTTDTYPQFPQWRQSAHAVVTSVPAEDFSNGQLLNVCGPCHSGDYRFQAIIMGDAVPPNLLKGVEPRKMNAVTCVICHDPHARTGNAVGPDDNRDYQLSYPVSVPTTPSNSVDVITDPDQYNLCGQCHRSRGSTWETTDRSPHPSLQSNVYIGDMPMPTGQEESPLVPNTRSVHRFVPAQCATCHMFVEPSASQFAPPIASHTLLVDFNACSSATGCHPSPESASGDKTALQAQVRARLDDIAARLGPIGEWGYSQEGGPADQSGISDEVKKTRFLYFYVLNDGSFGVHNPGYVDEMLTQAEDLLTSIGQ